MDVGRWRILLIHVVQDHADAMQTVYDTLQARFPEGKTGHVYAAIAAAFWQAYQKTHDAAAACVQARTAAQG